jgi:hypothetical protein
MTYPTRRGMSAEQVRPGMRVWVMEHQLVHERGDLPVGTGTVVARYGGEDYMAVDVRLDGGQHRLFWPSALEEISSPKPWWRLLLGRGSRRGSGLPSCPYSPECVE